MGTNIITRPFGKTANGEPVTLYTLSSATVEVDIIDYGAAIVSIRCPDRFNIMDDIVAGFSDVKGTVLFFTPLTTYENFYLL